MAESEMVARVAYHDRKRVYYVTCPEWDEIAVFSGNSRPQQLHPSETAVSLAKELEIAEEVRNTIIEIFLKISLQHQLTYSFLNTHT